MYKALRGEMFSKKISNIRLGEHLNISEKSVRNKINQRYGFYNF